MRQHGAVRVVPVARGLLGVVVVVHVAAMVAMSQSAQPPGTYSVEAAFQRISSFDQKPLQMGMPQIASQPMRKVR